MFLTKEEQEMISKRVLEISSGVYKDRYKTVSNVLKTKALFYELLETEEDKEEALFSVEHDKVIYRDSGKVLILPSLKKLFVQSQDLTEYTFATTYLDSFKHWKKIRSSAGFKDLYEEYREELEISIKSQALYRIIKASSSESKDSLSANKILLQYTDSGDSNLSSSSKSSKDSQTKAGRPTKAKILEEAQKLFKEDDTVLKDYERIINGGHLQ